MAAQAESINPVTEFVHAYGVAWNNHDLDAIMAMHAGDTTFCQHVGDASRASGHEAVREAFAASLAAMPDMHFETRRLLVDELGSFFAHEMTYTATMPGALTAANGIDGTGTVAVDLVDVITLRDGLVVTKDTYVDALAVQHQLGAG